MSDHPHAERASGSKRVIWVLVVVLTAVVGLGLDALNVPAAWILAAIVVSATVAITTGQRLQVPNAMGDFAKGNVAILAAAPIAGAGLAEATGLLLPALVVTVFTILIGVLGGLVLHRLAPEISKETGILSMLAGGAMVMQSVAEETGANFRYVALSQYLRLLTVSMLMPVVVGLSGSSGRGQAAEEGEVTWVSILVMLVVVIVGPRLGRLLRLPAASILGPILLALTAAFLLPRDISIVPPYAFLIVAFVAVGWSAGGALSKETLVLFRKLLPVTLTFLALLLAACTGLAFVLAWWLGIPFIDAWLATNPGGMDTAIVLAAEVDAGATVPTIQTLRLLGVLVFASFLPGLLRKRG